MILCRTYLMHGEIGVGLFAQSADDSRNACLLNILDNVANFLSSSRITRYQLVNGLRMISRPSVYLCLSQP